MIDKTIQALQNLSKSVPDLRKPSMKFRMHVVGFAHVPISEEYLSCAYTQKMIKFSKMMLSLGHEVYVYGAEGSEVPCTEFIQTHTLADIRHAWGDEDNNEGIGYDWKAETGFRFDRPEKKQSELYSRVLDKMALEINKRKKDDDILCLTQGKYHRPMANQVNLILTVETGIGYRGSFAKFRAFESSFLRNYQYGSEEVDLFDGKKTGLGKMTDRVIPNYFDDSQFDNTKEKEDYMLYIGRLVNYKGINIAVRLAGTIKKKLIVAGQGDMEIGDDYKDYVEFVGFADLEKRKELLSKAKLFLYPTLYREPFGGSIVEAMLSGTPVMTTNFGAFPEIVENGVNGYRCDMFRDWVNHAQSIMDGEFLHPHRRYLVRRRGERYLMDNVKWEFQKWFEDLYTIYEGAKDGDKEAWYRLTKQNDVK